MYPQSMFRAKIRKMGIGGSNEYPQSMFWSKNKKNIKNFLVNFSIFTVEKNICILHGHVFVMQFESSTKHANKYIPDS